MNFDPLSLKLCGLVEEYRLELAKKSGIDMQFNISLPGTTIFGIHETVLISKSFGFIKRLVDNDKIDPFYYESLVRIKRYIDEYEEYDYVFPMDYEQLIMLLSIQDNPIKLLITILKKDE